MQTKITKKKDDILFHYTSIGTLMKILDINDDKKICLRATHAKYFNDPFEYKLAVDMFKTSLVQYEKQNLIKDKKSQNFDKKSFASLGILAGYPYILSLSENADDLTMWRTYGADGKGVAIGFDKKMLNDYSEDRENINTRLIKCQYKKEAIIKGLIVYWDAIYNKINFQGKRISTESFRLIFDLSNFCFSFKRNEYQNEKEWRLCKNDWDNKNIRFQERDGLIIPYIEYTFPKEIIKKIIIGPCLNKLLTRESILILLKSRKFQLTKESIAMSRVPYRRI